MSNFSVGVDLGGTNLRIAAVNQQSDLMEKVALGTRKALGRDHVIHEMVEAIRLLAVKYKDTGQLQGIGIGVPGIIDMKTGMLREAISLGGSSVSDYVDADGEEGFFQLQHRVYGREGEPCLVCKTPIKRVVIAGRSSHYCPKCQK